MKTGDISGKKIYGERRNIFIEETIKKDIERIEKELKTGVAKKRLESIIKNNENNKLSLIKRLIYSKDNVNQKKGWAKYRKLSPKDQKAFKAEIRAEEKTHKPK